MRTCRRSAPSGERGPCTAAAASAPTNMYRAGAALPQPLRQAQGRPACRPQQIGPDPALPAPAGADRMLCACMQAQAERGAAAPARARPRGGPGARPRARGARCGGADCGGPRGGRFSAARLSREAHQGQVTGQVTGRVASVLRRGTQQSTGMTTSTEGGLRCAVRGMTQRSARFPRDSNRCRTRMVGPSAAGPCCAQVPVSSHRPLCTQRVPN